MMNEKIWSPIELSETRIFPVGQRLLKDGAFHRRVQEDLKPQDKVLIINNSNGAIEFRPRAQFIPADGYLMHFNIASATQRPHIEPLPRAHETISTQAICMVEGQKQYVLEMEVAVIGQIENGVMRPSYVGTLVDFGDRTPRIDNTGRTHKTWTTGIENGGSTGASTTWLKVNDWSEIQGVAMEYWVYGENGEILLHTPAASADTLKFWGQRLGDWVGQYPKEKLDMLGIEDGKPFMISTGQILFEDDGARAINPTETPRFTARGLMTLSQGKQVETIVNGITVARNEKTFSPIDPPFSYYA